jgi:hypothetical protein
MMSAGFSFSVQQQRSLLTATLLLALSASVKGWAPQHVESGGSSRRNFFLQGPTTLAIFGIAVSASTRQADAASLPSAQDLERLQLGHARVCYLLDHWDEVTRVCGTVVMSDNERKQIIRTEGGGGTDACTKTPLRVQEFMGYKSIEDPLYKVDKLMVRAGPLVHPDDFEKYFDTVEKYRERADNTALMAYTSSWGEANP